MKKPNVADQAKPKTVRGKWTNLLERDSNIAVLDLDIVDHFPDSESVNNALRAFLAMSQQFASLTGTARSRAKRVASRKTSLARSENGLKSEKVKVVAAK